MADGALMAAGTNWRRIFVGVASMDSRGGGSVLCFERGEGGSYMITRARIEQRVTARARCCEASGAYIHTPLASSRASRARLA